ncbi:MAG TPA: hypothetical protein VF752_01615, partial [Thermoleophilaceae bacterium]
GVGRPSVPRASAGPAAALEPRSLRHARAATTQPANSHRGIDYGWLAACAGLIAVASVLGRPERAKTAARASRSAVRRIRHTAARASG